MSLPVFPSFIWTKSFVKHRVMSYLCGHALIKKLYGTGEKKKKEQEKKKREQERKYYKKP